MTVGRRPHVGYEVRCDARGCPATTAAAPRSTHTPEAAQAAARGLLWLSVTIAETIYDVCPMQQIRDDRLRRWVPQPGCLRPQTPARRERDQRTPMDPASPTSRRPA